MNLRKSGHISPIYILFLRKVQCPQIQLCKLFLLLVPYRYIVVWRGERDLPTKCPPWARYAIDILQHNVQVDGDNTLVALVRLSGLFFDACKAINERGVLTVQNSRLILIGLEQQYQELQHSINHLILGSGTSNWVNLNVQKRD